jgi:hypothetical protein
MKLTPARALAPAVLALALAAGAGCSAGGNDISGDSSSAARSDGGGGDAPAAEAPAPEMDALTDDYSVADSASSSVRNSAQSVAQPNPLVDDRALIRHGNVALRADDVGKAQFEVQQVVDTYAGQVTEEKTTTDDDGHPAYTRMVLRIPADDFPKAMEDLKGIDVAELESANTTEDDVTTKVIDTQSRLKTQRRSIDRITVLFDRAESIRDIMAIEAQLSRRQAELDSLERQAAYLAGQTSMSTIVVSIDEIPEKKAAPPKEEDKAGFLTGLSAGWHGLTTFAIAIATVVGALLPWLIVVAIVGPPLLLLVRTLRRRRPAPPAAT